ncbi:MAG: aminoacyl-tRNA hydrolase [Dehalococcoidia bacterium]|nr:MAG: aminoacyl-tRNA hydrolase [Dehalococcoidia bacterium]
MPLPFAQFRHAAPKVVEPVSTAPAEPRPMLVVGLGNPGADYAQTRHNVGAWCIALLAKKYRVELKREGRVDCASITIDGRRVTLARPRSFMNDSGGPVAQEARRLHAPPSQVLVLYDELDLPVGRTRMRLQGSSGGNNGMKSLISALGSDQFARVRIGIDRPYDAGVPVRDPERIAAWVLSRPSAADKALLDAAVARVAAAVEVAVRDGYDAAMRLVNEGEGPTSTPASAL